MHVMIKLIAGVWKRDQIFWQVTVEVNDDKAKLAKFGEKEQTQTQLQHNCEQQCIIYYDYSLLQAI